MTIKTTVTEERDIHVEIPFFRKDPCSMNNYLFAVLNENTAVTIYHSDRRTAVENDELRGNDWAGKYVAERYQTWEPVTEQEFMAVYSEAIKSLSLEPVMA